ncbi:type II toxin-antitoxin system VapC family toxin [Knoellia sp. S7-12]|uniref:type II toxin-antitoxin system VapC family toxin n=1 Tax=Knoellia sp. S7-12 TaxID=3126698 RepID=UPI0033681DC1
MILLDTSALLWFFTRDPRMGPASQEALRGSTSPVHFSAISIVEFTIKEMIGKLQLMAPAAESARRAGMRELPFTADHAAGLEAFPALVRHDPFDRMLLAQARIEGMRLLTSDRVLLAAEPELTIDARA